MKALNNLQIFNYLIVKGNQLDLGVERGRGSSRRDAMLLQRRGGSRGDGPRIGRDTEISIWKWVYINSASAPTSRPSSLPSPYNLSPAADFQGAQLLGLFFPLPECVSEF